VWVTSKNFAILASTRLAFVSVYNKVTRSRIFLPTRFVHETPFKTGGETGTATTTETGVFNGLDDPRVAFEEDVFGAMPIAP
jgi:hypothetical protein